MTSIISKRVAAELGLQEGFLKQLNEATCHDQCAQIVKWPGIEVVRTFHHPHCVWGSGK